VIEVRVHVEPLDDLPPRKDRIAALRGQITILRSRLENDLPVTLEAVVRAERVAKSLVLEDLQ